MFFFLDLHVLVWTGFLVQLWLGLAFGSVSEEAIIGQFHLALGLTTLLSALCEKIPIIA